MKSPMFAKTKLTIVENQCTFKKDVFKLKNLNFSFSFQLYTHV